MHSAYHTENISWQQAEDFQISWVNDNFPHLQTCRQTRVLLIDDDRTMRRLVSKAIGDYCSLTEASSAGKGVSKYLHFEPDLIFLDLELPDNDGLVILEWILWNDPDAYIVLFSGHCNSEKIHKATRIGAKGYVSKPFDANVMMYHILQCSKIQ